MRETWRWDDFDVSIGKTEGACMKPIRVSTASGESTAAELDYFQNPFNVSIELNVPSGATGKVEYCIGDPVKVSTQWHDHDDAALVDVAGPASITGNFAFTVRGARVNKTAGSGTVSGIFLQAGMQSPNA